MPRRALVQQRPILLASIAAAIAWFYLRGGIVPELYLLPVKFAAVALLGLFLWRRHTAPEARAMATAMGIAAVADVAFEFDEQAGGLVFFAYHLLALGVFLQHRRGELPPLDRFVVAVLLLGPAVLGYILPSSGQQAAGFYALALGGMAAGAWVSTFPRLQVGAGALLFVASDLLVLAGMGPLLAGSDVPRVMVWPLYYLGQFMIATGVARTLRKRDPQLRLVSSR